jgi:hypothetical protein
MKRTALFLCLAAPCLAAPPAPWRVGTLVFADFTAEEQILQFPGSPTGFDCTNLFSAGWTNWCLTVSCQQGLIGSTYDCDTAPLLHTCLTYQVAAGNVVVKITNVDSDACK